MPQRRTYIPSPASAIVAPSGGDFTTIQAAIDALGSAGGTIFVRAGTYALTAGIRFAAGNITIVGEGPASCITFNSASVATAIAMADTTQRTEIKIRNLRISQVGTAGTGLGIDANYFARCQFDDLFIDGVNGGISLNGTGCLYNSVWFPVISCSGTNSFGIKCDNGANENTVFRPRIITASTSTGIVVNAHDNSFYDPDVETGAAVGVDIQASGHATTLFAPYLEGNVINLQFAANVEAPTIIGGNISSGSTNNIKNNGAKGIQIINTRLEFEQFTYIESLNGFPAKRWAQPLFNGVAATSATPTAGRVYLQLFELQTAAFVDAVVVQNVATVAGNVTVGIYGPITTEETCAGAPVIVQSDSTALSGSNADQTIPLTKTLLKPGRYYVAVEYSDATHTFLRHSNSVQVTGWTMFYDRGGGYGALTTPCPAVTSSGSNMPAPKVRLASLTTV